MGSGKTESAITQMNEDLDSRYIFVTPYLSEVERIKNGCPERKIMDEESMSISLDSWEKNGVLRQRTLYLKGAIRR